MLSAHRESDHGLRNEILLLLGVIPTSARFPWGRFVVSRVASGLVLGLIPTPCHVLANPYTPSSQ